jgi:hypothetical protein
MLQVVLLVTMISAWRATKISLLCKIVRISQLCRFLTMVNAFTVWNLASMTPREESRHQFIVTNVVKILLLLLYVNLVITIFVPIAVKLSLIKVISVSAQPASKIWFGIVLELKAAVLPVMSAINHAKLLCVARHVITIYVDLVAKKRKLRKLTP